MTIIITVKEPRKDWDGLNVKRFELVELYSGTNNTGISIMRRGRLTEQIKAEEIANIVITY